MLVEYPFTPFLHIGQLCELCIYMKGLVQSPFSKKFCPSVKDYIDSEERADKFLTFFLFRVY